MKTGLNKYPLLVQVICLPFTWSIMILKLLITIPAYVTMKCNSILDNIE